MTLSPDWYFVADTGTGGVSNGAVLDASGWTGLALDVGGNGETYALWLRTDQLTRPWQSFRADVVAEAQWRDLRFPFSAFDPNKTDATFDPGRRRRHRPDPAHAGVGRAAEGPFAPSRHTFVCASRRR